MHPTAMRYGKLFFDTYVGDDADLTIVDIGSQDVNGSLRSVAPKKCEYIGVDFEPGKGVDVIITDPYSLPFEEASVDVCVSSSCFEHSEFFWLTFLEIMRILKPSGLFYLNAPSNGVFHRYPVDCWRFYPDSGLALQNWARRNSLSTALIESFVGNQDGGDWNDFVGVFVKEEKYVSRYKDRIQSVHDDYTNGLEIGRDGFSNFRAAQEDRVALSRTLSRRVRNRLRIMLGKSP